MEISNNTEKISSQDETTIPEVNIEDANKTEIDVVDKIINQSKTKSNHYLTYFMVCAFLIADGAEMVVISILAHDLGELWNLDTTSRGMIGSIVFIGFFVGALISGKLSDTRGRKPVFLVGCLILFVFAIVSSFSPNYTYLLIFKALAGFGIGLSNPAGFALSTEITRNSSRTIVLTLKVLAFISGEIYAVLIAKGVEHFEESWRYLIAFSALPMLIAFLISIWVKESPRFLLSVKHKKRLVESLEHYAKRKLTEEENTQLDRQISLIEINNSQFSQVFSKKILGLTLRIVSIFFTVSFVYYGVTFILPQFLKRHSDVNNLEREKNEMLNDILYSCLAELPAVFFGGFISNHSFFGRIGTMKVGFLLTAIAAFLCYFINKSLNIYVALIKFSINIPFNCIYIYAVEAFPTSIRSSGVGVGSSAARIGGILTPILSQLFFSWDHKAPFLLYAIMVILVGGITHTLPFETLGRKIE